MSSTPTDPQSQAGPQLEYRTARIHGATFSNQTLRDWVESHLEGRVLNATAGPTHLTHPDGGEIVRNDIDPDADANLHVDVRELSQHYQAAFDTVLYDPPYSERQATVTYDCGFPGYQPDVTHELDAVLRPGGKVLQFGYTTDGLAIQADYAREHVLLINTLGRRHDVLAVIDRKPPQPDSPSINCLSARDSGVVMNEHASTRRDTQAATFAMTYDTLPDPINLGTGLPDRVAEWAHQYFQGRVLVLYPGTEFDYQGTIIQNHPTAPPATRYEHGGDAWVARTSASVTDLAEFDRGYFETVVFGPPASAFFENTTIDGTTTGLDTAVKRAVHDLLDTGGRLIQIGHTSTGMSSDYDYRRAAVGVFTTPGDQPDVIGLVDENQSQSLFSYTTNQPVERQLTCVRCPTAWDLHRGQNPALDIHCPSCTALTHEPCHTPDNTDRDEPHPRRLETAMTALSHADPCTHPDGHLLTPESLAFAHTPAHVPD